MKHAIPPAVLLQHAAFLGKTGSGKTSTAKKAVEQILADDPSARVCVLDPIKSDWWGLTSSADGRKPGLPFHILGGPRGHVALHESAGKAIGELVGRGSLPLSIIDMADFHPGGLQQFFNDFAPALLRNMRGVVYLVIEEAHEFAPKERAGIGAENLAIHWAKKLATAGRSKGIRMLVLTQRTQALHNALLGSCDTLIAHRLTAPADQEPVKKWLKANVSKAIFDQVSSSLSSLKTGSGWICSGEAQVAELVQFPKITTFDNSATPTGDMADLEVRTAPVDTEKLRAIIGTAVKEAEADDPKRLRAEIARLTALKLPPASFAHTTAADPVALIAAAERRGAEAALRGASAAMVERMAAYCRDVQSGIHRLETEIVGSIANIRIDVLGSMAAPSAPPAERPPRAPAPRKPPGAAASGLPASEQKIVDAIRWWNVLGVPAPTQAQVGFVAGYSHKSGTWSTYLSRLRSSAIIDGRGELTLTEGGLAAANEPDIAPTGEAVRAAVIDKISDPLQKILRPLIRVYPKKLTQADLAEEAGYSHSSGTWSTYLSRLRSLDLIEGRGELKAQSWMFP